MIKRSDGNFTQKDIARYNRVRSIANRYSSNIQKKLGLSDVQRGRAAEIGKGKGQVEGLPSYWRRSAQRKARAQRIMSDSSERYGDRQVSRRTYMGLSNG